MENFTQLQNTKKKLEEEKMRVKKELNKIKGQLGELLEEKEKLDRENIEVKKEIEFVTREEDDEQLLLERFWQSSGVEAAAAISARLAASAVSLASRYVLKEMMLARQAREYSRDPRLGKVGWPKRKSPSKLAGGWRDVPATWRLNQACSRNVRAVATPPRRIPKRKYEAEEEMLGISPLSPVVQQLSQSAMQGQLAAMFKLDARERIKLAKQRREREVRKLFDKQSLRIDEADDEDDELHDVDAHAGHGCEYEVRKDSSSEDEVPPAQMFVKAASPAVNISINNCLH